MSVPLHADHEHARAALRREPEAVDWLTERLQVIPRFVGALARRQGLTGAQELSDVSQEATVIALERLERYHGLTPIEAWLHRICSLTLKGHARSRRRRATAPLDQEPMGATIEPAEELESSEQRALVREAIESVGGTEAEVLRLRHLDGLDFGDIASGLDIPLATCRTRYYRGLKKLQDRLSTSSGAGTRR